jgi:hypothetical protein
VARRLIVKGFNRLPGNEDSFRIHPRDQTFHSVEVVASAIPTGIARDSSHANHSATVDGTRPRNQEGCSF